MLVLYQNIIFRAYSAISKLYTEFLVDILLFHLFNNFAQMHKNRYYGQVLLVLVFMPFYYTLSVINSKTQ